MGNLIFNESLTKESLLAKWLKKLKWSFTMLTQTVDFSKIWPHASISKLRQPHLKKLNVYVDSSKSYSHKYINLTHIHQSSPTFMSERISNYIKLCWHVTLGCARRTSASSFHCVEIKAVNRYRLQANSAECTRASWLSWLTKNMC